jgi:hypothetical protein
MNGKPAPQPQCVRCGTRQGPHDWTGKEWFCIKCNPAITELEDCDHAGWVIDGECLRCGQEGLRSDAETYDKENPR